MQANNNNNNNNTNTQVQDSEESTSTNHLSRDQQLVALNAFLLFSQVVGSPESENKENKQEQNLSKRHLKKFNKAQSSLYAKPEPKHKQEKQKQPKFNFKGRQ